MQHRLINTFRCLFFSCLFVLGGVSVASAASETPTYCARMLTHCAANPGAEECENIDEICGVGSLACDQCEATCAENPLSPGCEWCEDTCGFDVCEAFADFCHENPQDPRCEEFFERCEEDPTDPGEPELSCERLDVLCPANPADPRCEDYEERCGEEEGDCAKCDEVCIPDASTEDCLACMAAVGCEVEDPTDPEEPELSCERLDVLCPANPDDPRCEDYEERCGEEEGDCAKCDEVCIPDASSDECLACMEAVGCDVDPPSESECDRLEELCLDQGDPEYCKRYEELCDEEQETDCETCKKYCDEDPNSPECRECRGECPDIDQPNECEDCEKICDAAPDSDDCKRCRRTCPEDEEPIDCETCKKYCEVDPNSPECLSCKDNCDDDNGGQPNPDDGELDGEVTGGGDGCSCASTNGGAAGPVTLLGLALGGLALRRRRKR